MGKNSRFNRLSLLVIFLTSAAFYSCKDDVFNPEKVKAAYQDKFPVKDIDPDMDWKMTRQISINVAVYEDYGVDYAVRIYTENPLEEGSEAQLLAEGVANYDLQFETTADCPLASQMLYVVRYDSKGRAAVKPVDIIDGTITATFGWEPTSPTSRAVAHTRAYKATGIDCPFTDKEVEEMLRNATEYTGQQIIGYGIYKISTKYSGKLNVGSSDYQPENGIILIVAPDAKWLMPQGTTIPSGVQLVIASKGEVLLAEGGEWSPALTFSGNSSLVILGSPQYKIDDDDNEPDVDVHDEGEIKEQDGKKSWIQFQNTGLIYNRGEIDVTGIKNTGSTLYNYGELDLDVLVGNQLTVNHGSIDTDYIGSNNGEPQRIENYCVVDVDVTCNIKSLIMGPGSYLECDNFYPGDGTPILTLHHGSFIKVEKESKFSCHIFAPTQKSEYALMRLEGKITDASGGTCNGMIYFELGQDAPYLFKEFIKRGDKKAQIHNIGKAPAYIPEGNCSGLGNTPSEEPDPKPETPLTLTYAFEDNYPLVGDYDFNDVVLDVTLKYDRDRDNKITATYINISLAAAGASKTVGAGLRIIGDDARKSISNITFEGADKERFQSSIPGSMFSYIEEGGMVIPIFGSVHKVFGVSPGTLVNTGEATAPVYTYQIKIEHSTYPEKEPSIAQGNLDFFIAYQYKTMEKRMEVHLFEFWKHGATRAGTIQKENLDLAGNNTWAICVSEKFRYPKEHINVSTENNTPCAYPQFIKWARDRNSNVDWYKHPNSENVYR